MATTISNGRLAPPDWELVFFDVNCARCEADLRGRSEPICPTCGLRFDWAEAVPVEHLTCAKCGYHLYGLQNARCPECGTPFAWQEVLNDYRRRCKPLFEYRWRHKPIRSFIGTWFRALQPGRFWRSIDLHDAPMVRPLVVFTILVLVLLTMALPLYLGIRRWLMYWWWWRRWPLWDVRSLQELVSEALSTTGEAGTYAPAVVGAIWCGLSLVALMPFQQSMHLCRVRAAHILRIWAYCIPIALTSLAIALAFSSYLDLLLGWLPYRGLTAAFSHWLRVGVAACFVVNTVWSLRQAYRWYLHMPHSLGIAVASQIIALLATWTIVLFVLM